MAFPRGFSLRNADGTFVTKEVAMMRLKNFTFESQGHPTLAFAVPEKPKVPTSANSTVSQHAAANGVEKPSSSVQTVTPAPKSECINNPTSDMSSSIPAQKSETAKKPTSAPTNKSECFKKPKSNSAGSSKKSPPQRKLQPDETIDHKGRVRKLMPHELPFSPVKSSEPKKHQSKKPKPAVKPIIAKAPRPQGKTMMCPPNSAVWGGFKVPMKQF